MIFERSLSVDYKVKESHPDCSLYSSKKKLMYFELKLYEATESGLSCVCGL